MRSRINLLQRIFNAVLGIVTELQYPLAIICLAFLIIFIVRLLFR